MTPQAALDQIAALCAEGDVINNMVPVAFLREVLAEVTPEPDGDMQSPLAHPGDMQSFGPETGSSGDALDRDELLGILDDPVHEAERGAADQQSAAHRISALVRPAAGVTLTVDEVNRVRQWHTYAVRYMTQADDALAARLEAAL